MKCVQKLYPPDLTHVLQCIDRHLGIRYKTEVYRAIRSAHMKRFCEGKRDVDFMLSPLEKRVTITKTVAEIHERLARGGYFRRAFIATGT